MKVVCTRIPAPVDGLPIEGSPWVKLDREYVVLGVLSHPGRVIQLHLLVDGDGSLAWFDSDCFMTVDGGIPTSWTTRIGEGGTFELAPSAWHADGFWERYYDGDSAAQEAVRSEVAAALREGSP